jgi:aminomethyltransferase
MESPLFDWHKEVGAKLSDFGGWQMPIEYPQPFRSQSAGGVLAEHQSVRKSVGLFDVSHLGKIDVRGVGSLEYLNRIFTNNLTRIQDGCAQYTLLCDEFGGVIDDLIIYRYSPERFLLIPNAANCSDVFDRIVMSNDLGLAITNTHHEYGVLAVQGPQSQKVLEALGIHLELDYMQFAETTLQANHDLGTIIICRTGYTGEYGYELIPLWDSVLPLWELLLDAVIETDGRVCGLGARDTLRTEMGYPLHGHELRLDISPLEASAGWAVALEKNEFSGREKLMEEGAAGVKRRLRGLLSQDRSIPRAGMKVLDSHGTHVGEVTSGTFSPTLKNGIALALVDSAFGIGTELTIDVRGKTSAVTIVSLPFVPSHVR